jgi:hypothetical protein
MMAAELLKSNWVSQFSMLIIIMIEPEDLVDDG